jgi:hypothetical protein
MQTFCPTTHATLLLACRQRGQDADTHGPWLFPVDTAEVFPGLGLQVTPLTPIASQVVERALTFLRAAGLHVQPRELRLESRLHEGLGTRREENPSRYVSTLYLVRYEHEGTLPSESNAWRTLPEILRNLPQSWTQIPYLRLMQILSGAAEEDTLAVETDNLDKWVAHHTHSD